MKTSRGGSDDPAAAQRDKLKTQWYVYIMSNRAHTLYAGITNDLPGRVTEHKERKYPNAFTARYTFDRLVYYEEAAD